MLTPLGNRMRSLDRFLPGSDDNGSDGDHPPDTVAVLLEIEPLTAFRLVGIYPTVEEAGIAAQHRIGRGGTSFEMYEVAGSDAVVVYRESTTDNPGTEAPAEREFVIVEKPLRTHAVPKGYDLLAETDGTIERGGHD